MTDNVSDSLTPIRSDYTANILRRSLSGYHVFGYVISPLNNHLQPRDESRMQ